jgi:hypothetical protein
MSAETMTNFQNTVSRLKIVCPRQLFAWSSNFPSIFEKCYGSVVKILVQSGNKDQLWQKVESSLRAKTRFPMAIFCVEFEFSIDFLVTLAVRSLKNLASYGLTVGNDNKVLRVKTINFGQKNFKSN